MTDPFAPSYSEPVTLTGILDMDRLPSGKRFQGTWLITDTNQPPLLLSYRPIKEYFHLIGHAVTVTGRHKTLSPNVQQVDAHHFDADSITPTHQDQLTTAHLDALPPAPLIDPTQGISQWNHRWVHIHGTPQALEQENNSIFKDVTLTTTSKVSFTLSLNQAEYKQHWLPLVGKQSTILGKLITTDDPKVFILSGPHLMCEGSLNACPTPSPKKTKLKTQQK